jgi:hypothetical protein
MVSAAALPAAGRYAWWQWAWLLLAVVTALPVAYYAYQKLQQTEQVLRMQLIERYSLWETDPLYRGTPQSWTRFAARLLNTEQLMERVRVKHDALADQIEQDFRRDAALARGKVIAIYLSAWGVPLALVYGAGWLIERRRRSQS